MFTWWNVLYIHVCCRSNQTLGQFVLTLVNLFQPGSIWFFLLFLLQTKKIFWAPSIFSSSSFFSSSPLYIPHLLFPPCSPNIPARILLISMLTLWALNHRPLVFLLDSCPDALPVSHGDLDASSTIFLITYTL